MCRPRLPSSPSARASALASPTRSGPRGPAQHPARCRRTGPADPRRSRSRCPTSQCPCPHRRGEPSQGRHRSGARPGSLTPGSLERARCGPSSQDFRTRRILGSLRRIPPPSIAPQPSEGSDRAQPPRWPRSDRFPCTPHRTRPAQPHRSPTSASNRLPPTPIRAQRERFRKKSVQDPLTTDPVRLRQDRQARGELAEHLAAGTAGSRWIALADAQGQPLGSPGVPPLRQPPPPTARRRSSCSASCSRRSIPRRRSRPIPLEPHQRDTPSREHRRSPGRERRPQAGYLPLLVPATRRGSRRVSPVRIS